jgi:UPF0755 protein
MKRGAHPFVQVLCITLSVLIIFSFFLLVHLNTPVSYEDRWKEVEIPEGSTYRQGISILKENEIIKNSLVFIMMGKITKSDRDVKAGFYNLSPSMSPMQIFNHLIEGITIQYSIMIPEGSNLKAIKKKFLTSGLLDEGSWQLVYDQDFLDSLDIIAPSIEGYIYPDTYNFAKGTEPKTIFKIMVQRMREKFDETLLERAQEIGMTENEVLTLASIVEKEALFNSEMPIISAVYHNRLKKNMKLQADPTVLYGVKKRWKRIRYRDLRRRTPYNTYVIKGLPPGPIASPSIESIKAALNPSDVNYLYFVSMNNGRHHFSISGEEHVKAVELYQINGYNKAGNGSKEIN